MDLYQKIKLEGTGEALQQILYDLQEMAVNHEIAIREASIEDLGHGNRMVYDGLLHVPRELKIPINNGVILREFREVNYGWLNFTTSVEYDHREQDLFIAYAQAAKPESLELVIGEKYCPNGNNLRLPSLTNITGQASGELGRVLHLRDVLRANPIEADHRRKFTYNDKLVVDLI